MKRKITFCAMIIATSLLSGCGFNNTGTTTPEEKAGITEENAKEIALSKVPGATIQDIRVFKSDYDNGKLKYEGKIYYENTEYEFEIDANTGNILEWDTDSADKNPGA